MSFVCSVLICFELDDTFTNVFLFLDAFIKSSTLILILDKRPRGLNADAFFFKFAIIIIGLCATIEARKRN